MNCSASDCNLEAKTKGLCHKHYMRAWTHDTTRKTCSIPGCKNPNYAKGVCSKHRRRELLYGDPLYTRDCRSMTTDEYFVFKTHVNSSGCWIWTGRQNAQGYGSAAHDGLKMTAHRLSYEYFNGPIPQGLVVRHKCDVRLCVNPDHLDIGTRADNNRDTSVRDRTGNAKLTNADVVDIRWVHGLGASGAAIARAYNVTSTTISQIVNNQSRLNAR